ncbi:uncharacterized protein LOC130534961 [Takifugu flavidus]|uniref:uncharacterized protein LOC130534961 n=2 Tax=Takifugu flavidus TaxID=433684 RepID=UPI00254400DC|nr:uncharacterized protein LOC130534961 [Takifugu flavidus]
MPSVDEFLRSPTWELLKTLKKEQLLKVAEHFDVECPRPSRKDTILSTLKANLVQQKVLPPVVGSSLEPHKQVSQVEGFGALTFEQQKELLVLQHQQAVEKEARAKEYAFELEKLKWKVQLREAELKQEQQSLERYRLDLIKDGKLSGPSEGSLSAQSTYFDVASNLRLVPKFSEEDLDTFFLLFERLAKARKWSDSEQTLLLQCVLTGKAQEAFSALSMADSENYNSVKIAVLKAYKLVPEAYRQKFRTSRKQHDKTYVEFVRELTTLFNRWRIASGVETFPQLCELILLEQFKFTLPERITTFLAEHKVKSASEAAVLADEYALTHKIRGNWSRRDMPSSTQKMDGLGLELEVDLPKSGGIHEKQYQGRTCNYCLGQGHWKRECPVLKSNSRFYQGVRPEKPVALAVSVRAAGKAGAIAAVKRHTNSMVVAPDLPVVSGLDESDFRSVDPGYCSYVSQGFVSLVGSGKRVRVNILRDSGALDSFILESVLPFSSDSDTGSCVKVRGMGPNVLTVPLHKLSLSSNLVQGEVSLGVCSELPIAGIHVILGNDLARTHVQGGALLIPEGVTRSDTVEPGSGKHTDSAVYPVGVVTRAQSRSGSETEGKDKLRNCSRFPLFDPLLSVTRSELIQEQEEDSSLQEVFHQVRSEGVKIAQAGGAELG